MTEAIQTGGQTADEAEAEAAATAPDPRGEARGVVAELRKPIDRFDPAEAVEIVGGAIEQDGILGAHRRDILREDASVESDAHEAGGPGVFQRVSTNVQKTIDEAELLLDEERIAVANVEANERLSAVGKSEEIERVREQFRERRKKELSEIRFATAEANLAEREKALHRAFKVKEESKPDPLGPVTEALVANSLLLASRPMDRGQSGLADLIATCAKQGHPATPTLLEIASVAMRDPVTLHSLVSSLRSSLAPMRRAALVGDPQRARAAVELREIRRLRERVLGAKRAIEQGSDLGILARRWKPEE